MAVIDTTVAMPNSLTLIFLMCFGGLEEQCLILLCIAGRTDGSCGIGYESAKYCYPFDTVFKTSVGDASPEVIGNKKNAQLKVSLPPVFVRKRFINRLQHENIRMNRFSYFCVEGTVDWGMRSCLCFN